jgi:predicted DNA repair protein MutK
VLWAITKGSFLNKLIILPLILSPRPFISSFCWVVYT